METDFLDVGFVVWGCGVRFRRAAALLQRFPVVAVIDRNPACQGMEAYGTPVISPEMFLLEYRTYPVLITPIDSESIISFLQSHRVDRFFFLDEVIPPTSRPQMMIHSANEEWEREKSRALIRMKDMQIEAWRDISAEYFVCQFLNGSELDQGGQKGLHILQAAQHPAMMPSTKPVRAPFEILLANPLELVNFGQLSVETDALIVHGLNLDNILLCIAMQAMKQGLPIIFTEDGFLRSIEPVDGKHGLRFTQAHSLILDKNGLYIHADAPSVIEGTLASERELSADELERARRLITRIHAERLSKYNHQPRLRRTLGTPGRQHVLVVDQVVADKSIAFGWATDDTFREMLDAALRENPEAEIFIKAHPVKSQGHFADVAETDRIHLLTEPMNPIDLIDQMDKVYVCTSQLGFEAAFCGKEVHVFGMPFYAGWGFTIDAQKHPRRTKRRTVEEAFYFAYIACSIYVSYETQGVCEIEQAIDELITLRKTYQRRVLGGGTKKHLEWMLYRSAHLPSEGRAA